MRPETRHTILQTLIESHGSRLLPLVGIDIPLDQLRAAQQPTEPIEPYHLWTLSDRLLTLAVETDLAHDTVWRLLHYQARIRLRADLRDRRLIQHVLLLGDDQPTPPAFGEPDGKVTVIDHDDALFQFRLHPVRDLDPEVLLADPATSVFAPLGRVSERQRLPLVRWVAERIAASDEPAGTRRRLLTALAAVSTLLFDVETVGGILLEVASPLALSE